MIGVNLPEKAKVVVFEIWGAYGLFKKPYSPMSPVSYPIPPPTAIFGMVGAIAGWDKKEEEYLIRINSGEVAVGVRVMKPVQKFRAALNLLDTSESFRLKEGRRIQIPFEFLKNSHYRIFFWHANEDRVMKPLRRALESSRPIFTPCLGLANCLADVEYKGSIQVSCKPGGEKIKMTCVVPLEDGKPVIHYDLSGRRLSRITVPSRMAPDRQVLKYQELVVGEEGNGQKIVVDVEAFYECSEDHLLFF